MKLFTTTALATAIAATVAFAGSHTMSEDTSTMEKSSEQMATTKDSAMDDDAKLIRTRDITGGAIYTLNEANDEGWEADWAFEDVRDRINEIGEIEDIVLSENGEFMGIVAEIGGFLDIGDKHVMLKVSDVKLVAVDDQTYAYVTRLNEEQLEAMEGVDEGFWN